MFLLDERRYTGLHTSQNDINTDVPIICTVVYDLRGYFKKISLNSMQKKRVMSDRKTFNELQWNYQNLINPGLR